MIETGRWMYEELEVKDSNIDMQVKREGIGGSRYNGKYAANIRTGKPKYLQIEGLKEIKYSKEEKVLVGKARNKMQNML